MRQSSHADAVPAGTGRAQPRAGSVLALRNWRLASRLIVLVAIPTVLGLTLAGLRVADTTRSGEMYDQISQLAVLGQQVNGLAQAMEDERTETAAFIAGGRPAADRALLNRRYANTSRHATTVQRSVLRIGGYSAQTRSSATTILADIAELPGLRTQAERTRAPALTVINGYSAAIRGLFQINDSIAGLTGNVALIISVRTLDALARMEDDTALQQAILSAALAEDHFEPGALTSLTTAEAQQANDLAFFRSSATPEQIWALDKTLAEPQASQARGIQRRATAGGDGTLALSSGARQHWAAGMSYTVGWMRDAKLQLASWVASFARGLRRSAIRSAMATGGLALAALLLVVAATMIISRSMVRPLRRLEAAALEVAETGLPAEVSALCLAGNAGRRRSLTPIDVQSTDEIGQVARAVDRVNQQALRLAGEEAARRGGLNAIFASFLRRNSSLLEPLLRQIDNLELAEDDPERLAGLFQMDQLATRMRRNSDSALVLAGDQAPQRWAGPVTLLDLLRAAMSETDQYDRVVLDVEPAVSISAATTVTASVAVDIAHLLAELLENATAFSPTTTPVSMSGRTALDGGWLVRIADRGGGLPEEQIRQLNELLAQPPLADAAVARHMGLFAVAHLAARNGIRVQIMQPPNSGTTVEVHIPAGLTSQAAEPPGRTGAAVEFSRPATSAEATAVAAMPDPWFSARRFAAAPQPVLEPGPAAETDAVRRDTVPLLGAPLASLAPASPVAEAGPATVGGESAGLPIFDSVEVEYFGPRPDDQATTVARPSAAAAPPASDAGPAPSTAAVADATAAGGPASAGLPQRRRQASLVPDPAADEGTLQAAPGLSAQIAQTRLASFQQGSRRARAEREAKPADDE